MPIRHPPEDRVPPVAKKKSGGKRGARIVKYQQPPVGFWRRTARRIFRPPVVIALVFLTTVTIGVLGYYWYVFSKRIDQLLNGEIYTRSAGIYAAPKQLFTGESLSVDDLVNYLKRVGYVEKAQQADSSRGRYQVKGETIEVEPSAEMTIDGQRTFPSLRVQFARGGKAIAAINDLVGGARYDRAQLEPELFSSVTGQERAKRRVIGFKDLPKHLIDAVITTEDRAFFEHYGVNFRGIFRALLRRYNNSDPNSPIAQQGGSGITQQLVKNLLLSPERSLRRKLAEAYMSIILETRLKKEQIFELYCNQVYLGQQSGFSINGMGEAASAYFNKDVTQLTLSESAFLAGLIRSPNRYNPYKDLETATSRRNQVLDSMVETGAVSAEQAAAAKAEPLKVAPTKGRVDSLDAPYFADYVQSQLGDVIQEQGTAQHLRIYTTIDMDLQRAAYTAVTKQLNALDKLYAKKVLPGTLQAALVAMNPRTGEVIAMVGGRDYTKSQLNRVTEARRQPGSVFKPFVYATALNTAFDPVPRIITPASIFKDEPKTFTVGDQEYSPGNFGDKYSNAPVTLRDALVKSLNVVTVEVAQDVTIGRVMNLAAKAGLPKPPKPYLAMALGTNEATPLQVASAYTAFAASGTRVTPVAINRVTTGNGATVTQLTGTKNEVLRPDVAYVLTSMLKDVVNRGTAAKLGAYGLKNVPGRLGLAGKTGTSRDGWFAGYTPNLVCVVWVGFDDNSQLGLTGADSALPIWADFMNAALSSHPEWAGDWEMPGGIDQREIDPRTGRLALAEDPVRRTELFLNGTAPNGDEATLPEEEEAAPAGTEDDGDGEFDYEPAPLPESPPEAGPRTRQPARPDDRGAPRDEGAARLQGTITLDIDPTTGLIADPNVCPVIRSKTFAIGQEPRRYCGPEYHNGRTIQPSDTRPRRVAPD
ncbi:MAG TPA: PBP1A family penicillin-binding protein [Pyrinomonadaceae bacterium]|nr:PBP1A family penicillin-binding protein [Pyrinomonadaceae bacterium]